MGRIVRIAEGNAVEGDVELAVRITAPTALCVADVVRAAVDESRGELGGFVVVAAGLRDIANCLVADDRDRLKSIERALRDREGRRTAGWRVTADGSITGEQRRGCNNRSGCAGGAIAVGLAGVGVRGAGLLLRLPAGNGLRCRCDGDRAEIAGLCECEVRIGERSERQRNAHDQSIAVSPHTHARKLFRHFHYQPLF